MAFEPWSLTAYACASFACGLLVWFATRHGRRARWVIPSLMTAVASMLVFFVWWIGQGEENSYANVLYMAAYVVLLGTTAVVAIPSAFFINGAHPPVGARVRTVRGLRFLGVWAVLALATVVTVAYLGQRSLIYHPDSFDPGSASEQYENGRDVTFTTDDGLQLQA